jgi:peptidoglycan/LPS O-acetylase OafA/YrhL
VLRIGLVWNDLRLPAYVLMPARLDSLAIGGWLAVTLRGVAAEAQPARCERAVLVAGAVFVAGVFAWKGRFAYSDPIVCSIGYTVLAATFAAVLHRALRTAPRWLADPRLILLGTYSYALYVFHHPVILLLRRSPLEVQRLPRWLGSQLPAQVLVIVVAGLVSLGLAALSWHLWERPFLRLKSRFPYRTREVRP